jgi:hypothetical protein
MNFQKRLAQLERLQRRRPRAQCVEDMSDQELYALLTLGSPLTAEQWASLADAELAELAEAPIPTR